MSDFRIYGESVPDLVPDNEGSPKLLRESRRLAASAGAAWIGQAWGLFTRRWGVWVGMSFVMLLITTVVSMLPLVGFLSNFLTLFFAGGMMLAAAALAENDDLEFVYLFGGFQHKFKELFILTLLYFLVLLLVVFVFVVVMYLTGTNISDWDSEQPSVAAMAMYGWIILAGFAVLVPVSMMMWFATVLTVLDDVTPWQAMKMSFQGCVRNILPFIVYGLVWLGLSLVIGLLAMGLVMLFDWVWLPLVVMSALMVLVVTPWTMLTVYTSYRAVWTEPKL